MSHLSAYKSVIEKNREESFTLICEDDIEFHPNFTKIITDINLEGDIERPIIVFLGGYPDNPGLSLSGQTVSKSKKGSYSNYCYLINKKACEVLVNNFYPISRPDDSYKRWLINKGLIDCYQIRPSMVSELSAGVNNEPKFKRLSR
jgi:GR25 family glycosyltransferase involved in LPS biosynthesis